MRAISLLYRIVTIVLPSKWNNASQYTHLPPQTSAILQETGLIMTTRIKELPTAAGDIERQLNGASFAVSEDTVDGQEAGCLTSE